MLTAALATPMPAPAELTLSQVSARTVRVTLVPLDAKPLDPSTVLVPLADKTILRTRDLETPRDLRAGTLRIAVRPSPLRVTVSRADGKTVQSLEFGPDGVAFATPAPVLGLGEGGRQFDRRGALYAMSPGWGAYERPTHGSVVPSPLVVGTDGWALFFHRPNETPLDLSDGKKGRFLAKGAPVDAFVIDAPKPAVALSEFYGLVGKPALPPKWTMGYMQSHRTLAGPEEVLGIGRTFREKRLPCDALIYLGTGYCPAGWNLGHGNLQFNPKTFNRPAELIRAQGEMGFKTILHVNAAPKTLHGLSVTETPTGQNDIAEYWARHVAAFSLGVDGWWPDDGDELPPEARLARHRAYYEGCLHERPNERPFALHRTGYSGVARYGGWIWSGDIDGRWATLATHIAVGLNHALSLTPFWGTDTGGFYAKSELDGELYTRWFEFSAFCPLFRSHGRTWHLRLPWGWDTGEMGPIEDPDATNRATLHDARVEPICRKYLDLRYRLLPYNYTLAREAADTGMPMMRALWLEDPADPESVTIDSEYLWGRDLLVAPVVRKGATSRRLYLPRGAWTDWWTGERTSGGRWVERPVDLATLPLYVRAGAIVPLDPVRQYTEQAVTGSTTLKVFPGADGAFTLYDDDGKSMAFKTGQDLKEVWIRMTWDDAKRTLTLSLDPRSKGWKGRREFAVAVAGKEATKTVAFAGKTVAVRM